MRSYHQHEHEQAHPRQRRILFGNSDGTSRDYDFWRLSLEKPTPLYYPVDPRAPSDTILGCLLFIYQSQLGGWFDSNKSGIRNR